MREVISFLKECVANRFTTSDSGLAGKCLMTHKSFQLSEDCGNRRLIGLSELRRCLRKLQPKPTGYKRVGVHNVLLLVAGMPLSKQATEYIRFSGGLDIGHIISRDEIQPTKPIRFEDKWAFLMFALPLVVRCFLFKENRCNAALLMRKVVINFLVLQKIREEEIKYVYNFVPYEIDSNFQSLLLRQEGVHVTFIPSSGPLGTWNKVMICDEVVFSTPYHHEEKVKFAETMRFQGILNWGPERAYTYLPRYLSNRPAAKKKTLGFYSHGSWLRLELGHTQTDMDLAGAESACLDFAKSFVYNNRDWKLVVFTHPREKWAENFQGAKKYFESKLNGVEWEFADMTKPSAELFDAADIGLATFSTIIYERLYCGYKTLICIKGIDGFPMAGSSLNNLTFTSFEEMQALVIESAEFSETEFFERNSLKGYLSSQVQLHTA